MLNSIACVSKWTLAIPIVLFGFVNGARAAEPGCPQSSPTIKNLMAMTYRIPCGQATVPHQLGIREVKQLAATAESREDHLKLARYYGMQADRLSSEAARYEEAAATLRKGPFVKNLMAPSTAARYEDHAKGLREEAKSSRALAASQEQRANAASL